MSCWPLRLFRCTSISSAPSVLYRLLALCCAFADWVLRGDGLLAPVPLTPPLPLRRCPESLLKKAWVWDDVAGEIWLELLDDLAVMDATLEVTDGALDDMAFLRTYGKDRQEGRGTLQALPCNGWTQRVAGPTGMKE